MQLTQFTKLIHSAVRNIGKRGRGCDGSLPSNQECDDPLLDLQLRSYFRAEYGSKEPSRDAYIRLMSALRLNGEGIQEHQRAWSGLKYRLDQIGAQFGYTLAALYKAGSRADISRLVSGTLVAVLLVLAMAPNMLHLKPLNGISSSTSTLQKSGIEEIRRDSASEQSSGDASGGLTSNVTPQTMISGQPDSDDRTREQQKLLLEQKIGETFYTPLRTEGSNDLHSVERGIDPTGPSIPYSDPGSPRMPLWEQ